MDDEPTHGVEHESFDDARKSCGHEPHDGHRTSIVVEPTIEAVAPTHFEDVVDLLSVGGVVSQDVDARRGFGSTTQNFSVGKTQIDAGTTESWVRLPNQMLGDWDNQRANPPIESSSSRVHKHWNGVVDHTLRF